MASKREKRSATCMRCLSSSVHQLTIFVNSPDSSTLVCTRGYVLLIFLRPSVIFGSSEGLTYGTSMNKRDNTYMHSEVYIYMYKEGV